MFRVMKGTKAWLRAVRAAILASRPLGRRARGAGVGCCSGVDIMLPRWRHARAVPCTIMATASVANWPVCGIGFSGRATRPPIAPPPGAAPSASAHHRQFDEARRCPAPEDALRRLAIVGRLREEDVVDVTLRVA